jgi:Ca2+-binding RTX toxin-like protein
MSQASAYEQYLLELINADRAQAGAQPLVFDGDLNEAAESHSQWMLGTDTFSHTGVGGSNPGARMSAAGYVFSGSWTWGENIAWASTRSPTGYQDEVQLLHTMLMNSDGHRANLLNDAFREVGLGFEIGNYSGWDAAVLTEDFARSGSSIFLTGVAFDDRDGDRSYDPGESLNGLTVTAVSSSGARYTTTTLDAGGYDLALPAGNYSVTFSGSGIATTTMQAMIGSRNVKLDLIDPAASAGGTPVQPAQTPPASTTITATSGNDRLIGTSSNDTLLGLAGNDRLEGLLGNDRLEGGAGDDSLWGSSGADTLLGQDGQDVLVGGAGRDVLTGGAGPDYFVFNSSLVASEADPITDFSPADDTIYLEDAIFKALRPGVLPESAFYVAGSGAYDAADRIIFQPSYELSSGANVGRLFYDADGSGGGASVLFALVAPGLDLTPSDFLIG